MGVLGAVEATQTGNALVVSSDGGTITLGGKTYHSKIKWWCWDEPGFKECHAGAFAQAQAECEKAGLRDDADCIGPSADSIATQKCECRTTPPIGALVENNTGAILLGAVAVVAIMTMGGKS